MLKKPIIADDATYTFTDYFKLNYDIEDILAHFGYSFEIKPCTLPQATREAELFAGLRERLEKSLPHLRLTSEMARREFLIAPVLQEVVLHTQTELRVEYPLEVSPQLGGTVDYYLHARHTLLVVEAKKADLQRGFTQLAVELVACDQVIDSDAGRLYGAVSTGDVWRFGLLEQATRHIIQDLNLYRVPADLHDVMKILIAIVTSDNESLI